MAAGGGASLRGNVMSHLGPRMSRLPRRGGIAAPSQAGERQRSEYHTLNFGPQSLNRGDVSSYLTRWRAGAAETSLVFTGRNVCHLSFRHDQRSLSLRYINLSRFWELLYFSLSF